MQEFFTWITTFFTSDIYQLITSAFAHLVEWLTLLKLHIMLWTIQFSWDVAVKAMANIGVTQAIQSAWSGLDSDIAQALMYFRVPDAINLIANAFGTRFVLKFIPIGNW